VCISGGEELKKLDLGQTITILANVGVIAGIILLAIEIDQNNQALGTQARLERENILREARSRRVENPDLIRATVKARASEVLSADEVLLLDAVNLAIFTDLSLVHGQVRDGLLDEDSIPLASWRHGFHDSEPRAAESWSEYKKIFSPDFVRWYEENVIQAGPLE